MSTHTVRLLTIATPQRIICVTVPLQYTLVIIRSILNMAITDLLNDYCNTNKTKNDNAKVFLMMQLYFLIGGILVSYTTLGDTNLNTWMTENFKPFFCTVGGCKKNHQ